MASSTIRKPRGIPVGGQFAAHNRDDAAVGLTAPRRINAATELTGAEALRIARMQAGNAGSWRGGTVVETDDIAQDAIVSVLITVRNAGGFGLNPGVLTAAARSAISRSFQDTVQLHHDDLKALRLFDTQRESVEQFQGRHLTDDELDGLAADIREDWPNPRHRPTVGFNRRRVTTASVDEDPSLLADVADQSNEMAPTSAGDDLADALDDGRVTKAEARLRLWNALADSNDIPLVARSSMTEREIKAVKQAMKDSGGVEALVQAHLAGNTSENSALFAPFGLTTTRARDRIAEFLLERPAVADRLWASALAGAER